jgi:hypothetical protein
MTGHRPGDASNGTSQRRGRRKGAEAGAGLGGTKQHSCARGTAVTARGRTGTRLEVIGDPR